VGPGVGFGSGVGAGDGFGVAPPWQFEQLVSLGCTKTGGEGAGDGPSTGSTGFDGPGPGTGIVAGELAL
jgi:hypothetical protein